MTEKTAKRPKRPTRQRKSDRMLHSGVTQEEIRCDFALAPLDHMAHQLDHKWGVDVLVELVPPEMAERYGAAMAKLNAAIDAADPEQVSLRAGVCMRGLAAMDRTATESGATPASQDVWLVQADGREFGLMRDMRAWPAVQKKHPNLRLISEREMILAIEMYQRSLAGQMVQSVKDSFPQADVIKIPNTNLEDEIPF